MFKRKFISPSSLSPNLFLLPSSFELFIILIVILIPILVCYFSVLFSSSFIFVFVFWGCLFFLPSSLILLHFSEVIYSQIIFVIASFFHFSPRKQHRWFIP